jgi:hypothetical protein
MMGIAPHFFWFCAKKFLLGIMGMMVDIRKVMKCDRTEIIKIK